MRIGILGGGQLGRMLALAGYPLDMQFRLMDTSPDACAGQVAELYTGDLTDKEALTAFAEGLDVITFEWENVDVESARFLVERTPFYPPPRALAASQDRLVEKALFRSLGIETAPFASVEDAAALPPAVEQIGLPAVLKTRRLGYDGRGQWMLRSAHDIIEAAGEMDSSCILEGFVPFQRELSIIAVRGRDGETAFYPLVQNHHYEGILRLSLAPAPKLTLALQAAAEDLARRVLDELAYVGVLAIELFEVEGRLLANEMAPRVHNSGHWSIEGAACSQFENHLRAIAGLPLGSTAAVGHSAMLNLIGTAPDVATMAGIAGAHVHLYGKSERPNRKIGHVTLRDADEASLRRRIEDALLVLGIDLG